MFYCFSKILFCVLQKNVESINRVCLYLVYAHNVDKNRRLYFYSKLKKALDAKQVTKHSFSIINNR